MNEKKKKQGKRLVKEAIKATGKKGFAKTKEALEGKPGIKSPEKLAGWLKGQAKARGELSSKHPYVGRRKKRKKSYSALAISKAREKLS